MKINTLPSIKFLAVVLGIPIQAVYEIIKFYTDGLQYQKYTKSMTKHLQVSMIRRVIHIPQADIHFLAGYRAKLMLKVFSFQRPRYTRRLPNYGQDYDKNSFWLVKPMVSRSDNDPVIVYLHGGAYSWQFAPSQLKTMLALYELFPPEKKERVSILVLDYKLASQGYTFPAQREQLHETYTNLTKRDKCDNIILVGDSAGGHLAVSYSQYLKNLVQRKEISYEDVVYPLALLLVSPWLRIFPGPNQYGVGTSFYENNNKDILTYQSGSNPAFVQNIFGNSDLTSPLVSPLLDKFNIEDWSDNPTFKNDVLVIAGENEVLRDDILDWSEKVFSCSLLKQNLQFYNNSDGIYSPSVHSFLSKTEFGKVGVEVHVDPWGLHDSAMVFEDGVLDKILKKNKHYYSSNIDRIDLNKYFGVIKMAEFLNRII